MAMPQRDDPPTPSSFAEATADKWLRRTSTIEAIKRRAAEKKAAEEKEKAEARARAAYQRHGARCRLKRFPPTSRNWRGRNGRKSCARSSAASRGCDRIFIAGLRKFGHTKIAEKALAEQAKNKV